MEASTAHAPVERDPADYPFGTVGIACGEVIRSVMFAHSLATMTVPVGTRISIMSSANIVENFNIICRHLHGEWLWIQADDHIFEQDACLRLLDRNVDVVVPLMTRRAPPYVPLLFHEDDEEGKYMPYAWNELPIEGGLIEVFAAGTGGMLVRRHVLEAIAESQGNEDYFEYEGGTILNEDLVFCRKIRDLGFTIHADLDVSIGHRGAFTVFGAKKDGAWGAGFDMGADKEGKRSTFFVTDTRRDADTSE